MFDEAIAVITALGSAATAGAVVIAVKQLQVVKELAQTNFEDDLSREYRAIVGELPAAAFYTVSDIVRDDKASRTFYRYFDLSNEQLFLCRLGRVRANTAEQWKDGMRENIERLPAFQQAWVDIAARAPVGVFEDLRALIPPESVARLLTAAEVSTDPPTDV